MSTNILNLIPEDPAFVPAATAQREATQLLNGFLPGAREIAATVHDDIIFVDQGGLFETVSCPACGVEWTTPWWQDAMDESYRSHFRNLLVTAPCCGTPVSLNELRYDRPAGFARFVLRAEAPWHDLTEEQQAAISAVLGCRLRKIWARY